MADQYQKWRDALAGKPIDWPKDHPPAGFWRQGTTRGQELIAIWYDDEGVIHHQRSIFSTSTMYMTTGAEIGEALSAAFRYPVPHEIYRDVTKYAKSLPPEYTTRLTLDEIRRGVKWTPELGRAKLGLDVEPFDENPRAVIGGNDPPEETPDGVLAGRVKALVEGVKNWLAGIGGKPTTKADADTVANYATKFSELKTAAETSHKAEKEPILIQGREIDARWFGIRDEAAAARKRCLELANDWMTAEKARLAEEARKANEAARKAAEKEAAITGNAPEVVQPVEAPQVKVGTARAVSQRTRTVWVVNDLPAFAAYLASREAPAPDFLEVCNKLAQKLGTAGVAVPGIEKREVKSAA